MRFQLYVAGADEDAGRWTWQREICMITGDWKGPESDWDKDGEMKCPTCASLHCPEYEKLSAVSMLQVLMPGGI